MLCRRWLRPSSRLLTAGVGVVLLLLLLLQLDALPAGAPRAAAAPRAPGTAPAFVYDEEAVDALMAARAGRVADVCRKHGLGLWEKPGVYPEIQYPPAPQYSVFYFDRKHKLGYCPLYKAGTTSWLYNFALLGGFTEEQIARSKQQISTISRQAIPELEFDGARAAINDSFLFMVVRHPFDRVLSAYRDKLENIRVGLEHGTEHFYQRYGRRIVQKYRQQPPGLADQSWKALNLIGDVVKRAVISSDDSEKVPPLGIEPTFNEFVRYLIDTDLVNYSDDHWIPYYLFCTPCSVRYHAIAKFATIRQDQEYILHRSEVGHLIRARWRHQSRGKSTKAAAASYFSTITRKQAEKLYEKYKLDFELFDYSPDEYFRMTM